MSENTGSQRTGLATALRVVSALVVIGSAVAVTAISARGGDQVAVIVPQAHTAPAQPAGAAPALPPLVPLPVAPGAPGVVAPAAAVPLAGGGGVTIPAISSQVLAPSRPGSAPAVVVPGGAGAAPGSTPIAPGAGTPISPSSPTAPGLFDNAPIKPQPKCPLGWPAPTSQGGLASLIGLAPLAGPFSSEAFALGPVYQPLLQLVGPVLAEISPIIAKYQPAIDPIIKNVQGVEDVVLQAILPYYGPYRGQLLAAEGELAKQILPALDSVYNSEPASCLVAWQGQVIQSAKGGNFTVPSLAHPGTVVELGPKRP